VIIGLIIINVLAAQRYSPVMPHVQVPPEHVAGPVQLPLIDELYLSNTLVAILITDLLLLLVALVVRNSMRRGEMVPAGITGVVGAAMEALYNMVESTTKEWARRIFPWVATIILMVLIVNWMELIPGVDSVGLLHKPHHGAPSYTTEQVSVFGLFQVTTIKEEIQEHTEEAGSGTHDGGEEGKAFTPLVRVASTDLNFTLALALVSVTMTQVIGLRASNLAYLKKFFNFKRLGTMLFREQLGPFELIFPFTDVFVGLLEMIAEFAKILSFSFRLFGNIFAGSVLLFVIGSVVPVAVQSGFLFLELIVGAVQALVFGMLTLVFMSMATETHDEHNGNPA
jgi:F-type H+-transporting ATPase subunit a